MNQLTIKQVSYHDNRTKINSIRRQVFQEEQGVAPELEFDGKDESAQHLLAYRSNEPVGTIRIRPLDDDTAKIERLAVLPHARRKGIGKQLMETAVNLAQAKGYSRIQINSQAYIQAFYQRLGFEPVGEEFEEAGIPHIQMIKKIGYLD
jgi:predicted GNAT family N-acyltransferase